MVVVYAAALVHHSVYNKLHVNVIRIDLSLYLKTQHFLLELNKRLNGSRRKVQHTGDFPVNVSCF